MILFKINRCKKITEKGLKQLGEGLENSKKLKRIWLDFGGCDGMNNKGMEYISEGLRNIVGLKEIIILCLT